MCYYSIGFNQGGILSALRQSIYGIEQLDSRIDK